MKVCRICLRCYEDTSLSCSEEKHGTLTDARPGSLETIDGYRLEFLDGIDEIGETYRAIHSASNQSFTINIIAAGFAENNPEFQARFLKEAKSISEINCPNVARVFESGILPDGSLYVVGERIGGQTLRERLNTGKPLSEISAVGIARQTAEALEAIHSTDIAHRNIKPENIILSADAENGLLVKTGNVDFAGLRQNFAVAGVSDSESGLNDLKYFSPEQCSREKTINGLTDIYSLGIVLYEMLAGKSPFESEEAVEIIDRQINETPKPVQISNFDIRALLTHTLNLSLQKVQERRLKSANAFARQLRHIEQYATRSFSSAVTEQILTDEKLHEDSYDRNGQIATQIKELSFPKTPPVIAVPIKPVEDELISDKVLIEDKILSSETPLVANEELLSVSDFHENEIGIEAKNNLREEVKEEIVVLPKTDHVKEIKQVELLREIKPDLVEWEQPEDIPTLAETVEVLNKECIGQNSRINLAEIREEKDVFNLEESDLTTNIPLMTNAESKSLDWKKANNFGDIRQLISVPNGKIFIGGGAALALLILSWAFFGWRSSETQSPSVSQTADSKAKQNKDTKETAPEKVSSDETAVVEMPELPDSKTFNVRENEPVTEKIVSVAAKPGNQSAVLKDSSSLGKINPKKAGVGFKEKSESKPPIQNAFPDVKIIIGKQNSDAVKPPVGKSDIFSRPRIVKKNKSLRVF